MFDSLTENTLTQLYGQLPSTYWQLQANISNRERQYVPLGMSFYNYNL